MSRVLITGSAGLVGQALRATLEGQGHEVRGFDLSSLGTEHGDVRDRAQVDSALDGATGVIHLAAVSRVVWGERDPVACWNTNVEGLRNVVEGVRRSATSPWLIFASSREVYGQPDALPVTEDAPLRPVNIYGRSKVAGEQLVEGAQQAGFRAAVVRLSNVYGSADDHDDRVVPAFARGAVQGTVLRVDGSDHTFDFTHLDDTVRGITALAAHLEAGRTPPPPIHFLTGSPTTLGQLAALAKALADSNSVIAEAPPRSYDVSRFHGSPARAGAILGWTPRIALREGLARLVQAFRDRLGAKQRDAQ